MVERDWLPIVTDDEVITKALRDLIELVQKEVSMPNRIKIFRSHRSLFTIPTVGEYGTFYGTRRVSTGRVEKHHLRHLGLALMSNEYGLDLNSQVKITDITNDSGVILETYTFYPSNISGMNFASREDFYHGEIPASRITWSVWDTAPHLRFRLPAP